MPVRRKAKADKTDVPEEIRDFEIQAEAMMASVEGGLERVLAEEARRWDAFVATFDHRLLDMNAIDFLSEARYHRDGVAPGAEAFDFTDDDADATAAGDATVLHAHDATLQNATLANATMAGEESFMLPQVPATGRGGRKRAGRPPPTTTGRQGLALRTPAPAAASHMPLMTPGTELRAPRLGEVMYSVRGSPLVADAPGGSAGHLTTVIKPRHGEAPVVVTDSPFDPSRGGPSVELDDEERQRLRNLHAKLGHLLTGRK